MAFPSNYTTAATGKKSRTWALNFIIAISEIFFKF